MLYNKRERKRRKIDHIIRKVIIERSRTSHKGDYGRLLCWVTYPLASSWLLLCGRLRLERQENIPARTAIYLRLCFLQDQQLLL